MTDEQRARKIASLAWEIQPKFRAQYKTEDDLAQQLIASGGGGGSILGIFLPVCLLEVLASVESYKDTLAHAELDSLDGEATVSQDQVEIARRTLEYMTPLLPEIRRGIEGWINPR